MKTLNTFISNFLKDSYNRGIDYEKRRFKTKSTKLFDRSKSNWHYPNEPP